MILTGPFTQVLPLTNLPARGPLSDDQLTVIPNGGILHQDGRIIEVGDYELLRNRPSAEDLQLETIAGPAVALPGFIDCHTHLLFAGSRAMDFAARNAGKTYQEIGAAGGGIKDTVRHTRAATDEQLAASLTARLDRQLRDGITTVEVKSGYGLSVAEELRMLRIIKTVGERHAATVVPTCLAAHVIPPEMPDEPSWLATILRKIVPIVKAEELAQRFDIFVENGAFTAQYGRPFLEKLRSAGFGLTVHGDQFTPGGSRLAHEVGALSVDHLEASGEAEIELLGQSATVAVALPGATLGLGCAFAPARKLLDAGAILAIASDWNPGSAPMGDLLTQASIIATFEKLTTAEVLSGLTSRAAAALGLTDRGTLSVGNRADFITFPAADYRDILYYQGQLKPKQIWIDGSPAT